MAPSELETYIHWYQAYYHFCRPQESLRVKYQTTHASGEEVTRFRSRTPMRACPERRSQSAVEGAAGLTRHRWSVQELLLHPLAAG